MDRISTATKAVDLFGAGKHGFKDGNLALGILPTDLNAALFNGLQEEVLAVIEAAGLVPSAATLNQLLLALRAAGVFTTPAQFDNTTKAATTAFSKTRGIEASGITVVAVTGALGASVAGGTVVINAGGATTQTLPAAATIPAGARIEFMNVNAGAATIQRAGADTLQVSQTILSSLVLGPGDTLTLECSGAGGGWYAVGGTAQLKYAAAFAGVISGNGYQSLPSGFIVQWGTPGATDANGLATFTHPIAFPNNNFCIIPQFGGVSRSPYMTQSGAKTLATSQAFVTNSSGGAAVPGVSVAFIVIGN